MGSAIRLSRRDCRGLHVAGGQPGATCKALPSTELQAGPGQRRHCLFTAAALSFCCPFCCPFTALSPPSHRRTGTSRATAGGMGPVACPAGVQQVSPARTGRVLPCAGSNNSAFFRLNHRLSSRCHSFAYYRCGRAVGRALHLVPPLAPPLPCVRPAFAANDSASALCSHCLTAAPLPRGLARRPACSTTPASRTAPYTPHRAGSRSWPSAQSLPERSCASPISPRTCHGRRGNGNENAHVGFALTTLVL